MNVHFADSELEAYLDENLLADEMARIEAEMRQRPELLQRLVQINRRRDSGIHSLGEIWRRHRISCPPREQLGSFLLGVSDKETAAYVEFHVTEIGCRLCQANLEDLKSQREKTSADSVQRRRKYFQTSAGYLSQP